MFCVEKCLQRGLDQYIKERVEVVCDVLFIANFVSINYKMWDKMYKRLRLTNCDSPMYQTLEKTQELQMHPPKKYKCF